MGIANCRFKFRCIQTWESLSPTEDRRIRHCSECAEDVHLCATDSQLAQAIKKGLCVAIPAEALDEDEAQDPEVYEDIPIDMVGRVDPGTWGDE